MQSIGPHLGSIGPHCYVEVFMHFLVVSLQYWSHSLLWIIQRAFIYNSGDDMENVESCSKRHCLNLSMDFVVGFTMKNKGCWLYFCSGRCLIFLLPRRNATHGCHKYSYLKLSSCMGSTATKVLSHFLRTSRILLARRILQYNTLYHHQKDGKIEVLNLGKFLRSFQGAIFKNNIWIYHELHLFINVPVTDLPDEVLRKCSVA